MSQISENLAKIKFRIKDLALRSGRNPDEVKLVAVSKNFPPEAVAEAFACGQRIFGENRAQELEFKRLSLMDIPIEWHMIGHLQSNKVAKALKNSVCIHSIDSLVLLEKAERICREENISMDFLLEVNISGEESKFGIRSKDEVFAICDKVAGYNGMKFKGLMTMAPIRSSELIQRGIFSSLRELSERLKERLALPRLELSMGMSSDYESAIAEGSTILRIGSAIFGERK